MVTETMVFKSKKERRHQRSPWASQALQYQLRQVSERYRLDSMVLADTRGRLWAACTLDPVHTHLASSVATMGVLAEGKGFTIAKQQGRSVRVKTLKIGEATLYLAAQGAQKSAKKALEHAACGVERILGALI